MIPALLALSLFAAPAAAARRAPLPVTDICACSMKARCWNVVMHGFDEIVRLSLKEVESALPGRFYLNAASSALRNQDAEGHFLELICRGGSGGCADKRDELERRMLAGSLLLALPHGLREDKLRNPKTWELTEKGDKIMKELKACRPTVWLDIGVRIPGVITKRD